MRRAPLTLIVALLLAATLAPQSARAATANIRFGVHLTIRESCEVRTDANSRQPAVDCRHGQSFAVTRRTAATATSNGAHATTAGQELVAGVATQMWTVTF